MILYVYFLLSAINNILKTNYFSSLFFFFSFLFFIIYFLSFFLFLLYTEVSSPLNHSWFFLPMEDMAKHVARYPLFHLPLLCIPISSHRIGAISSHHIGARLDRYHISIYFILVYFIYYYYYIIGTMYSNGRVFTVDFDKAMKYFIKAANKGNSVVLCDSQYYSILISLLFKRAPIDYSQVLRLCCIKKPIHTIHNFDKILHCFDKVHWSTQKVQEEYGKLNHYVY